jgi:hypothetical protein
VSSSVAVSLRLITDLSSNPGEQASERRAWCSAPAEQLAFSKLAC